MDQSDIRKLRLRALIDHQFGGRVAAFAQAVALKPEQVYRWLTKNPTADTRRITEDSARRIESTLGLIPSTLDNPDPAAAFHPSEVFHGATPNDGPLLLSGNINTVREPAPFAPHGKRSDWPFELVDRARYYALPPDKQRQVQQLMNEAIALCETGKSERAAKSKRPA